jgi:hypothetical protein
LHDAGFFSPRGLTRRTREHQATAINDWAIAEGLPEIANWVNKPRKYVRVVSPQPRDKATGKFVSKVQSLKPSDFE